MDVCKCGRKVENKKYVAFDLHNGYEEKVFCSRDCLMSWVNGKIAGLAVSLILGFVILFGAMGEMGFGVIMLFFLPYMIRSTYRRLGGLFNSGGFGEFLSFFIVLIGTITVIYPLYKLVQEIRELARLKKEY